MSNNENGSQSLLAYAGIIAAAAPIISIIFYAVGYYILINYFRILKIFNIEFLKTQSLETGVTFFLIGFASISLVLLLVLVRSLIKDGYELIANTPLNFSMSLSLFSLDLLIITTIFIDIFIQKGEWDKIKFDYNVFLFVFLIYIFIQIALNRTYNRLDRDEKAKESLVVGDLINIFPYLTSVLRVLVFIFSGYYFVKILFFDLIIPGKMFLDPYNLYYLLHLFLFTLVFYRLVKQLRNIMGNKLPSNLSTKSKSLTFTFLLFINAITFYLLISSYIWGPFLYIPASKGGSYNYSSVTITFAKNANDVPSHLKGNSSDVTKKLLFLTESDKFYFVTDYLSLEEPRKLLPAMIKQGTYSINKNIVQSVKSER